MSASQLLIDLRRLGVSLSLVDGRVQVQAPPGALTDALRAQLKARRDELAALLAANDAVALAPIARLADSDDAPLSPAQQRLWLLQQIEADPALYLIPAALELTGALDVDAVRRTVDALVQRHDALRTAMREHDGEPRAVRLHAWPELFEFVDIAAEADPEATLTLRLAEERARGIDLAAGAMLRVRLYRLDARRHVLLLLLHHIAGDAQSMNVLTAEFAQGYAAFAAGGAPAWTSLPLRYADYAAWQGERRADGDAALAWWRDALADLAPVHALPTDRPRPEQLDNAGARHVVRLDAAARHALAAFAQTEHTTVFVALQAAFALALKRHGDAADVVFATPVAGRTRAELEPIVGFFVNTLALRHRVDESLTARAWLARTKAVTLAAFERQDVPFDRVIDALNPPRSLSHAPLVQIMLSYQRRTRGDVALAGLDVRTWPLPQAGSKFELSLDVADADDGLELTFDYNTRLFDAARIAAFADRYAVLLGQLCAAPDAPLAALDMLRDEERATIEQWEIDVDVRAALAAAAVPSDGATRCLVRQGDTHVPAGVAGELVIAGDGERLQRTGIRALWKNGELHIVGPRETPVSVPESRTAAPADTPLSDDETALLVLFREVLAQPAFGAGDDFFRAGGHSLAAAKLAGLVRSRLGRALELRQLFAAPNVRALAAQLANDDAAAPMRLVRGAPLALSPAQRRLWFLQQIEPASASYNMPGAWRIDGALDVDALHAAFAAAVARHEVLHSRIVEIDGTPMLVPDPDASLAWRVNAVDDAQIPAAIAANAATPFDLARDLPLRVRVLRCGPNAHVLLACLHHVAADGASLALLLADVRDAYAAACRSEPAMLAPLPLQYADYADWHSRTLDADAEFDYWRDRLAGAPTVHTLALDYARPARPDGRGDNYGFDVPANVVARVDALAAECGVTPFLLYQSAFAIVLARYANSDEIVLGTPVSGRGRPEFEPLVGFFANTLALRTTVDCARSLPRQLRAARLQLLADLAHQALPFDTLVERLGLAGQGTHAPLFQILVALHETGTAFALPDVAATALASSSGTAKFDLSLHLTRRDGGLAANLEYATALWHPRTIAGIGASIAALLADLAQRPETPVGELALAVEPLPAAPAVAVDDAHLWTVFERAAAAHADGIALEHGERRVDYAALRLLAERGAGYLHAQGVRGGDVVGLCLARGVDAIVAMLACLRLGAAYLPLDPAYPRARLARIVEEARPRCVVADAAGVELLRDTAAACIAPPEADAPAPVPPPATEAEAPAYVLYTSGSTGVPKGVAMPHRALTQLLAAQTALQPLFGERLATLQFTSLNFDVSFQEIFTAFATGSRLVLVDEAQRLDLPALVDLVRERGVERLFVPVAVLTLLPSLVRAPLTALRLVTVAGEALAITPALRAFFARHPACRLVNHYGPTETHVVTAHTLGADPAAWPALPPIGVPLPNLRLAVRDARGAPVPRGAIGELYIAGPALALGYLHRPELTAERFVVDADGARAYRTGDRVALGADGELRFLSRNDGQIKRRGFRIETGEIAAQLQAVPGVRAAAVDLRTDPAGEARLVAWLAADDDAIVDAAHAHLARTVPAFMLPDAYAVIATLPLTVNGKLDRAALPSPAWQGVAAVAQAPATPTETRLLAVWRDVLGNDALGVTDNFFAHGGHSLLAVRLLARVRDAFAAAPPLAALFAGPTVRELAACIDAGVADEGPASGDRTGRLPLSFGQARLWALEQLSNGAADYAIPAVVALDGALDATRLFAACDAVVARHEILRTRFVGVDGEAAQVVHATAGAWTLADADADNPDAQIAALVAQPFDLAHDAPIRVALLRHTSEQPAPERHVLVIVLHHIAADAASLPVLLRDLAAAYAGRALAPAALQYGDYARWQRSRAERDARDLAWWRDELADLPTLHRLPLDRPRPAQPSFAGATHEHMLPAALIARVDALAAQLAVSRYVLLQAAFVVLLHHIAEDDDIVVGTPSAGRDHAGLADMVGFFVNTLVLRHRPAPQLRFDAFVGNVAATLAGALAHQETPFEQLVDALQPLRTLSHNPLFQIMFSARRDEPLRLDLPGIEARALGAPLRTAKFDLSLDVNAFGDGCAALWEYATDLFAEHSVRQFAEHYERVLDAATRTPHATLAQLAHVDAWPDTPTAPVAGTALDRIRAHVLRAPQATAIEDGDVHLDYATLWRRANALAARLPRDGAPVAVLAPRSRHLAIGELAAWLAGRPFVPLDPANPATHLQAVANDAGVTALVRHPAHALALGCLDLVIGDDDDAPIEYVPIEDAPAPPHDLAYLIYTSGSTGTPKGVAIGHDNLAAYCDAAGGTYTLAATDRVLQLASPGFDIAIEEVIATLAHGATIVVAGDAFFSDGAGFCAAVERHAITVTSLPTAFWHALADTIDGAMLPPCWRLCAFGGEAVRAASLARWQRQVAAGPVLLNTYGPTETTVVTSAYRLERDGRVAIGRPFGDTRLCVVRDGHPVAPGVPGELLIGGALVGRGYHGQPARTADAFSEAHGLRWYRSGDRVRMAGDGELEYFGRIDDEAKVRGFRVDPAHVSTLLSAHPDVRQATVVVVRDDRGDASLAAYVVADAAPDAFALRDWLAARVPAFMLPDAWLALPSLPLTVNGKIDRRRLPPAPKLAARAASRAPRDGVESDLAAIWRELLSVPDVGADDNFFARGGNSLTAIRLKARVETRFNVALDLADLFTRPTLAALAERIAVSAQRVAAHDLHFLNDLLDELE